MILSLIINDLSSYLIKQIKSSFPDNKNINESFVKKSVSNALDKIELCFEKINLPYYKLDNKSFFNHLHGDHYSSFLYQLSREFYIQNNIELATKVFQLNKKLFGIDVFYTTILPEYYIFVHPIGTVKVVELITQTIQFFIRMLQSDLILMEIIQNSMKKSFYFQNLQL